MQAVEADPVAIAQLSRASTWALPPLGRRAFIAFRIAWLAALLLALVAISVGNYRDLVRRTDRPFSSLGLGWENVDGRVRLSDPNSSEARAAGIRAGLTIVAVDGVPVPAEVGRVGEVERRLKVPEGSTVRLTTRAPDGRVAEHRLTRSRKHLDEIFKGSGLSPELQRWIDLLGQLLPSLVLIAASVLLLRGRRNDAVPAILSFAFLVQAGANFGTWSFYEPGSLPVLRQILLSVAATGIVAGLLAFPHGRFEPRWTGWAAALTLLWGVAFCFAPAAQWPDLVWLALLLAAIAGLAHRYRRLAEGRERQQIRWVLLGFAWGTALLLLSTGFYLIEGIAGELSRPVAIWTYLAALWLGSLGFCAMAAGLLVALLRYRLYDVDAIISRSAGYALLTVGFVAVFAASEKMLEILGERYFSGMAGSLSGGISAALAAVMVAPLHNRMHGWAERRFQKGLQHLRRDVPACVEDMRETAPLPELMEEVLARIVAGVRASRAAALVGGRVEAVHGVGPDEAAAWLAGAPMEDDAARGCVADRSDPLFPMRLPLRIAHSGGAPLGWILLGPRPDGSFYAKDEEEALAAVADPVARAIRIVELRREREEGLRAEIDGRLRALEAQVAALARARARPAPRRKAPVSK